MMSSSFLYAEDSNLKLQKSTSPPAPTSEGIRGEVEKIIGTKDHDLCEELIECLVERKNLSKYTEELSKKKFEQIKNLQANLNVVSQDQSIDTLVDRVRDIIGNNTRRNIPSEVFVDIAKSLKKREDIAPLIKGRVTPKEMEKILPLLRALIDSEPEKDNSDSVQSDEDLRALIMREVPSILSWCDVEEGDDNFYQKVATSLINGESLDKFREEISKRKFERIDTMIKSNKELMQAIAMLCPNEASLKKSLLSEIRTFLKELNIEDIQNDNNQYLSEVIVNCLVVVMDPKDLNSLSRLQNIFSECKGDMLEEEFDKLTNELCNEKYRKILTTVKKIIDLKSKSDN